MERNPEFKPDTSLADQVRAKLTETEREHINTGVLHDISRSGRLSEKEMTWLRREFIKSELRDLEVLREAHPNLFEPPRAS